MTIFSSDQRRELLGLALMGLALFIALSLVPVAGLGEAMAARFPSGNLMGTVGRVIDGIGTPLLGFGLVFVPVFPAVGAAVCFGWLDRPAAMRFGLLAFGLAVLIPVAVALPATSANIAAASGPAVEPPAAAGAYGPPLAAFLVGAIGSVGTWLVLVLLGVSLSVATLGWNPVPSLAGGGWRLALRGGTAARSAGMRVRELAADTADGFSRGWSNIRRRAVAIRATGGRQGHDSEQEAFSFGTAPAEGAEAITEPAAASGSAGRPDSQTPAVAKGGLMSRLTGSSGRNGAGDEAAGEVPYTPVPRPPLELLTPQPPRDASLSDRELDRLGDVLLEKLATFRVEGAISGRTTGPVVTQFEVVPAPGIKVSKIANLDADLALALKAPSIRIVAPIPGKGAVGVEVPNPRAEVVYLRGILEAGEFGRPGRRLPLALGRDLTGNAYVADLARMPHLLIAGATGSGKSVCINTLITSLVFRHSPEDLRLLMIDPKMVELSMYQDLPHLRHPVVTDPKDAAFVLKWAVLEMERRYELLSENGTRSVEEFNRRVREGLTVRRVEPDGEEGDPDRWIYADGPLPYIVIVVDELADLMMSVQSEIERPLAQLAQKARAIGIHLVVATQRPSVNVITGLIKANFSCRIAFRVSSKVDSRTILDQNGADSLLGNGDMLFLPPGHSDPVRLQGAFIPTEDTSRLVRWYRDGAVETAPEGEEDILELVRAHEAEEAADELNETLMEERDPLFRNAAEVCIQFDQGSTSLLQRRLRVGYGRAARIMDQLHTAGVVGPPDGSRPREVQVGLESLDHICEQDPAAAAEEEQG